MLKSKLFAVAMAVGLSFVGWSQSAQAVILVDQNQPSDTINIAFFSQTDLAQSFKQSANNIAGAGIFLRSGIGTSDTVTIGLWDVFPMQVVCC